MNYLDWLEAAETWRAKSLVPTNGMTKEVHEIDKAYWKGYLDAARDANRHVKDKP
jgi:hypothetical protein